MRRTVLSLLLVLAASPLHAQGASPFSGPLSGLVNSRALGDLARRVDAGGGTPETGAAAPTHFTPNGKRLLLDVFVNGLAKTADEKKALNQVFQLVFTQFEKAAEQAGAPNDVAAALVFNLVANYGVLHEGTQVSDATSAAMLHQLQAGLSSPAMTAASDTDKQKLYEYFVLSAGFTIMMQQVGAQQKDAKVQKAARLLAEDDILSLLKVDPDRLKLTDTGLSFAPPKKTPSAEAAVSTPQGGTGADGVQIDVSKISYQVPDGWSEQKSGTLITVSRSAGDKFYGYNTCSIIVMPGVSKRGVLRDSLLSFWKELVIASYNGEESPTVYVRRIGDGENIAFARAAMRTKDDNGYPTVSLFLIDARTAVVPILATTFGYDSQNDRGLETFVTSVHVPGASGAPLPYSAKDLVGSWSNKASSIATYVNSSGQYVGDASTVTAVDITFHSDGTYTSSFRGYHAGSFSGENEAGPYRLEGDMLIMHDTRNGRVNKKRLLGFAPGPGGDGRMFIMAPESYGLDPASLNVYGEKYYLVQK